MTIQDTRDRLVATDATAHAIQTWLDGDDPTLEFVCPEPGTVVGDRRFVEHSDNDPNKMFMHIKAVLERMDYYNQTVFPMKRGRSTYLYRSAEDRQRGQETIKANWGRPRKVRV